MRAQVMFSWLTGAFKRRPVRTGIPSWYKPASLPTGSRFLKPLTETREAHGVRPGAIESDGQRNEKGPKRQRTAALQNASAHAGAGCVRRFWTAAVFCGFRCPFNSPPTSLNRAQCVQLAGAFGLVGLTCEKKSRHSYA